MVVMFDPISLFNAGTVWAFWVFGQYDTFNAGICQFLLPALQRGLARAGRARASLEVMCATLVVTGDDEAQFARSRLAARKQLAFYGSTPAYRSTLDCHGWGALHEELNRLSKLGRWDDMAGLIDDSILETIAVVGTREEIAPKLRERLDGIADSVSLTHNRCPDPAHWADVVRALKGARVLDAPSGHR